MMAILVHKYFSFIFGSSAFLLMTKDGAIVKGVRVAISITAVNSRMKRVVIDLVECEASDLFG